MTGIAVTGIAVNRITRKTALIALPFFLLGASIAVAAPVPREESAKKFAESVQSALPFTTLTALAWSDAYIGQIVSRKPHFGAGVSYGMSTADFSSMRELSESLGAGPYVDISGTVMPPLYGYARIGGFFVPFDVGIIANLPADGSSAHGFTMDRQTYGGDIRFSLVREDSKSPEVSLGAAYTQTIGSLETYVSGQKTTIYWNGSAAELKAQLSKTLSFITPYIGAGGGFTWTQAGYRIGEADAEEVWGMDPENFANGVLFRVFGGASIKLWIFRFDLGINLSIPSLDYGAVAGLRVQL
jgi:hypothetical protein